MKNHFFLTLLSVLFMSATATAQCPVDDQYCVAVDLDFQTSGNGVDISHLNDWTYSHGSPSVWPGGFWLWSYNNKGEGINYSGYNFIAGQEYTICFVASTQTHDGTPANASATFNIVGTNAPVGGYTTTTSSSPIPAIPAGSQVIVSENWATYPNPGTGTYTYTFTATNNFSNLWFYPSSPTLPQVEIGITQIVICQVEKCDASFTVCLNKYGPGTSSISTTLNNPNNTVVHMSIEENGIPVYSGPHVSYIGNAGSSYTICITAVNNITGEECKYCYSFCLGKDQWSDINGIGKLLNSTQMNNKGTNIPDGLKDQPLEKDLGVSISPNPSNRLFEVSSLSAEIKLTNVTVYDLNSKEVSTGVINENQTVSKIDMKDQPVGIYLVKIQYADGSVSQQKIVVER